jgi:hypothetical protein
VNLEISPFTQSFRLCPTFCEHHVTYTDDKRNISTKRVDFTLDHDLFVVVGVRNKQASESLTAEG